MVRSKANWQLVTTFNEWGEGSAVESAQEWASPSGFGTYLDALKANGQVNGVCQPVNTKAPVVNFNKPVIGETVTADPGGWLPALGADLTFQYRRCASDGSGCVDIPGATNAGYTVAAADEGSTLRVTVTATNGAGSATAGSTQTGIVVPATAAVIPNACGTQVVPPAAYQKVVWIFLENKSIAQVVPSNSAPYMTKLAAACGLATNYAGITHPSLPNYIAATSGDQNGIVDDLPPTAAGHSLGVPSIFSQVRDAGGTWRSYQESAPGNCPRATSGSYAVKHDPAPYYSGIAADCANWDVPLGTLTAGNLLTDVSPGGSLPSFSFITPNLCNDTHDCPVASGDNWVRSWLPKLVASPDYTAGNTVIFITFDENDGRAGNLVSTIVISPSTRPGTTSSTSYNHYSLLHTAEELLRLPFLANAATAASMATDFNLR
jgi:hypothetical protein